MANATFAIPHFLGGVISRYAQGRFDKPDYHNSLNVCLNGLPVEIGPWTRRPGTMFAGTTLNGAAGRVIEFKIEQRAAITLEFTDANLRFRMGPTLVGGTLATPYTGGSWASIRAVQAETTDILLAPTVAPQALTVTTPDTPVFALNPAIFNDGPYLDPFTNGVQATPSAKSGIITLTLAFPAWDATKAYALGSFVTTGGVNYVSLQDQNVNNAPASLAPWWATTSASAAINDGMGFIGTDIGRLVRLFSEPAIWLIGTAYVTGNIVAYNPSGLPGATTYWQALANSTGKAPGSDLTNWQIIPQGAAIWSWGKITSLSNIIDRALAGSTSIGNMTEAGGLAAAFDGIFSQAGAASAQKTTSGGAIASPSTVTASSYVGKNYSGASDQKIHSATVYPSSNDGLVTGVCSSSFFTNFPFPTTVTLNLRGKTSAPASASDGTLLGTSGSIANTINAVTILSNNETTAWKYVWIEMISVMVYDSAFAGNPPATSSTIINWVGELSLFNPTGTGISAGCNVEILGPPLLYTTPILTWRLGVYSNTTGWPTCGIYNDGRLYLGGAVGNRFDACYSNGIVGGTINFAPTDQYGVVTAAHAISYTFNSNGVNPILWMEPDLQGVKAGTQAGEWLIQAPTAGPISPLNITARNVTNHGSANIQPVDTEHTLVFVQRHNRKLLEYFPDVFSGKFSAPNLADKAQHLTLTGVSELAYTSAVTPIIWGRCADGSFFGITYKRDSLASSQPPTFYGWHSHALGSSRLVESICAGPSVGGDLDALTMVTNDPLTGIRHVEILTDTQDELTPLADSWFLDDAAVATVAVGPSSVVLSGLGHLEGKTVQAFASGLDLGDPGEGNPYSDFVVSSGAITVPFGDSISAGPGRGLFTPAFLAAHPTIIVGFTYNSDGQLTRAILQQDSGSRLGPSLGLLRRVHRYAMLLSNTIGLRIGTSFSKLDAVDGSNPDGSALAPLTMFSGITQNPMEDNNSFDGMICWRVARPFPATVVSVSGNLAAQDQ